jgi:ADP-ribose pyrophosphatase YjhB (NUDIX family)
MDTTNTSTIQAAGGLLWREIDGQRRLAVIHRPRHNDWTLPKGKLQPDEDFLPAARREVFEETGCEACVDGFAGTRAYSSREGYKVVSIWHMHCDGTCTFTPSAEVDDLQWLTESEALACLTYPDEAAFLRSALPNIPLPAAVLTNSKGAGTYFGIFSSLRRHLPGRSTSHKRLVRYLAAFRAELSVQPRLSPASAPAGWQQAVYSLVDQVEEAARNNNTELGWRCLNAAQRIASYRLSPRERQITAQVLVLEAAGKLSSWRKQSVNQLLLDVDGSLLPCIDVESLIKAMQILHEHNENTYLKLYSFRSQLFLLSLIGLVATAYLFIAPGMLSRLTIDSPLLIRYIILFGVLGASISGTLSMSNRGTTDYITNQLLSSWIAFARVAVGAVAALVVYAFLNAGLINIEASSLTVWAVLAVSFAAGFSERLLTRAVGAVGG